MHIMGNVRIIFLIVVFFAGQVLAGEINGIKVDYGHEKHGAYHVKFYGTIKRMPEKGYAGVWIVNGRKISVTNETIIKEKHGIPEPGAFVAVEGLYSGKEFSAQEIEVKRDRREGSNEKYNP